MKKIEESISLIAKELLLNESGIRIPKGTKAARVLFHVDLDGLMSAIITKEQLKKQGIPERNIAFQGVQYGDDEMEMMSKQNVSRGQMLAVVDFGKVSPQGTQPDFASDHHEIEGDMVKGRSGSIGKTEFKSDFEHLATSHAQGLADPQTIKHMSMVDSASFTSIQDVIENTKKFKEKGRFERLANITNTLVSQLLKSNRAAAYALIKEAKPSLINVYSLALKHSKLNNIVRDALDELSKPNPDWKKIDEIRNNLPAEYKTQVSKDNKSKIKNLNTVEQWQQKAIKDLARALTGYVTKKEKKTLEELEGKISGAEDPEETKKAIAKLREFLRNTVYQNDKETYNKVTKSLDELKSKNDYEAISSEIDKLSKKQGTFHAVNNKVMRQDASFATMSKGYPSRYLGSAITDKSGKRWPFLIKRFDTMIQVSANPDIKQEDKEKIDLVSDMNGILQKVKEEMGRKFPDWSFDVVKKESGGHKTITNISALGTVGLMPKKDRERLKELQSIERRIKDLKTSKKKMEDITPEKHKELKILMSKRKKASEDREEVMNEIEKNFYKVLREKYKDIVVDKKIDPKYTSKEHTMKENISASTNIISEKILGESLKGINKAARKEYINSSDPKKSLKDFVRQEKGMASFGARKIVLVKDESAKNKYLNSDKNKEKDIKLTQKYFETNKSFRDIAIREFGPGAIKELMSVSNWYYFPKAKAIFNGPEYEKYMQSEE